MLSDPRPALQAVSSAAVHRLEELWHAAFPGDVVASAEQVRDFLLDALPPLGQAYGDAAATAAASWFDAAREAVGAPGTFAAALAPEPSSARWEALARWGVDPLFRPTPDPSAALTLVSGGLQRSVAAQHRETIMGSAVADPAAKGWMRVGVGNSCDFCAKLLARGAVYTTTGAQFRAHDHCNCAAAPAWAPNVVDMTHVNDDFVHSTRFRSAEARIKNARMLRDY